MLPSALQRRFLLFLFVVAVALGIGARVAHLDRKLFWQDEDVAAVHVSGHHWPDYEKLFDGRIHSLAQVRSFIELDRATNLGTVLRTMSQEDAHLAPLFYILDRWTLEAIGGGSIATYRLPSVVAGILSIGLAFAFGLELFQSRKGGMVLAAIVALSPFHILYARQTREYALFGTFIFAANLLLLRALRRPSVAAWIAYAFVVAGGTYTDSLFTLVVAAHAVFAAARARRNPRELAAFVFAAAAGLVAYVPWALHGLRAHDTVASEIGWGNVAFPLSSFIEKWAFNVAAVFFDTEFSDIRLAPIAVLVLAIVAIAIVVVARSSTPRIPTFAFALTAIPIAAFIGLDALHGSHFSTIPRYLTEAWIGLEVIVAGAILGAVDSGGLAARGGYVALAFLLATGAFAAIVDNGAENWWDNNDQVAYQSVARRIDTTPAPLVVSYFFYEVPLMLAPYLRPDTSFLLYRDSTVPELPKRVRQAYLVVPYPEELTAFEQRDGNRYRVTNASPQVASAITEFHKQLARDKTYGSYGTVRIERPDNALWSFELR